MEATKTDVSQVVDSNDILNLPINGRSVDSFVLLTPNVSFVNKAGGKISATGTNSNVTLGGASFQNLGSITVASGAIS